MDYFAPLGEVGETPIGVDVIGEVVYEYTWYLPDSFCQQADTWYWISIVAIAPDNDGTPIWGWHSGFEPPGMETEWAAAGKVLDGWSIPVGDPSEWSNVRYNMAFELSTIPEPAIVWLVGVGVLGVLFRKRLR